MNPPLVRAGAIEPPVALATLAAWTEHNVHAVRILDLDLVRRLRPLESGDWGEASFAAEIAAFEPDVVGVTSMYSNSLHAAKLIRLAKRIRPGVVTLAGGCHFGALPREALQWIPELDFVVHGEGETGMAKLLEEIAGDRAWAQVPSLAFRHEGEIVVNPNAPLINLADLPAVWRTGALDPTAYLATIPPGTRHRVAYLEAGRGCPYHCSFCSTASFWRRKFRTKPVEAIVAEMRFLCDCGYNRIVLVHDLLTVRKAFISELCDALLASRLPCQWMANSRADLNLDGLLPTMKAAGCWKLFFGVESASPRLQEEFQKGLAMPKVYAAASELARHGLAATFSFVIGFPSETRAEIAASIGMGARLKLFGAETVQFHRLRLWPPAEIAVESSHTELDRASLLIEFPLPTATEADLAEIAGAPTFFTGFHVSPSKAGDHAEIAQLEMFAHHAVALAPMTVLALIRCFPGARFIDELFAALKSSGHLSHDTLDWDLGLLQDNWRAIEPSLTALGEAIAGEVEQRIVMELLAYERHRLKFFADLDEAIGRADSRHFHEFHLGIDVPGALRRLAVNEDLPVSLLQDCLVRFERVAGGGFAAFSSRHTDVYES